MIARAPGKLLLTGAYAVLEGAPAIVLAVDRCAVADGATHDDAPGVEIRAALGDPPKVDVSALYEGTSKLGLGSSAAALVAALGVRLAEEGKDLSAPDVRETIFERARAAHAKAQGGGSGVDIAASVHGGVLEYRLKGERATRTPVDLPPGLHVSAFFSGTSARTSELRARVDALRVASPKLHAICMDALKDAAERAARAVHDGDRNDFLSACLDTAKGLDALGNAADAPIVRESARELLGLASLEGAVFFPSGAGGGDVFVFVGVDPPSEPFKASAERFAWKSVPFGIDRCGIRTED
jgi:phosphomevalonate kinase